MISLFLRRFIALYEPYLLMPPAIEIACKILELPLKVYIPGFFALPVINIFTSLNLERFIKASAPMFV